VIHVVEDFYVDKKFLDKPTPWSSMLIEQLTKKFPSFYKSQRFMTLFTRVNS